MNASHFLIGIIISLSLDHVTGHGLDNTLESLLTELQSDVAEELTSLKSHFLQMRNDLNQLIDQLEIFDDKTNESFEEIKSELTSHFVYSDCQTIYESGQSTNGVYTIHISRNHSAIEVYCSFDETGSWLVFQRREDGSVNFNHNWTEYSTGFGNLTGEHWLGNTNLNIITDARRYSLCIDLEDWENEARVACYDYFHVASEDDLFELTLGDFIVNDPNPGNAMSLDTGMKFSTPDRDNDVSPSRHCAQERPSGWWFPGCGYVDLNNRYHDHPTSDYWKGIVWFHWKGYQYSLKRTMMRLQPIIEEN